MKTDNHFVPKLYLKNFSSGTSHVYRYRTLAPSERDPAWKHLHISKVAYQRHLYTTIEGDQETDRIESWLDSEFEAPGSLAIKKAIAGANMAPSDWKDLVRFAVLLSLRTPAQYLECLKRWDNDLPAVIESSAKTSVERFERGERSRSAHQVDTSNFPSRITITPDPSGDGGYLEASILAGRSLWLWEIERHLKQTIRKVPYSGWTILRPPPGATYFTSDNPVVKLSYSRAGYDFQGGWGNPGTNIFVPLDPHHLLFTEVGQRAWRRGSDLDRYRYSMLRRFMAQHAHRMIFAHEPDETVEKLRPRVVDRKSYEEEKRFWASWHEEQTSAEIAFRSGTD